MKTLPRRARLAACLLLCWAGGLSCGRAGTGSGASADVPLHPTSPPAEHPLNLVLVVLDTTRPDYLTPYGGAPGATPFLDRFATQATRFERAYSSSCWTLPAHATMFTGALPVAHGATQSSMRVERGLPLLAETLRDAGYATAGFSENPWIGNDSGLKRGFQTFEPMAITKKGWVGGRVPDETANDLPAMDTIAAWLDEQRERRRPFFLFVNLMRAHHPYIPSPDAARELLGLGPRQLREALAEFYPELPRGRPRSLMNRHYEGAQPLSPAEWERLGGLYRASLRSADADLQRVIEAVDQASDAPNTLVLIVSDHGESLGEHGHFGHIMNLYETGVRVAFLARGPGFEPGTSDGTPVHLADVYSTLLAAARVADAGGSVGVDLARHRPQERILSASLEAPSLQLEPFDAKVLESGALDAYRSAACAAIGRRYKLIARSDGSEELYDLELDPAEATPLDPASIDPSLLAQLRASIEGARPGRAKRSPPDVDMDAETLESLRSLGYVK